MHDEPRHEQNENDGKHREEPDDVPQLTGGDDGQEGPAHAQPARELRRPRRVLEDRQPAPGTRPSDKEVRPGREREAEPEQHGTEDEHHAATVIQLHVTAHDGDPDTAHHAPGESRHDGCGRPTRGCRRQGAHHVSEAADPTSAPRATGATRGIRVGASPTTPSSTYLDLVAAETAIAAAAAPPITSPHDGASIEDTSAIRAAADSLQPELVELSHRIFEYAEEGFEETQSVADIAELLAEHGITAQLGAFGLDTALVAELVVGEAKPDSTEAPTVAILAEYDALPGVGHGCGHNIIAASAVGAFLSLVEASRRHELPAGRIVLYGTPAEEGGNGKEIMARAGAFDDVDAAIMIHPFGYDVTDQPFIGRRILRVRYYGVPAHASASPFQGRNALDAANLNYQATGLIRQHLYPGDRIHGVILDGGQRPNVVPEFAELEYYVRSNAAETLKELSLRLEDIANGIALATGTGVEVEWDPQPFTMPLRYNTPLSERWAVHQEARGRRVLTKASVPSHLAASTDFGNVSVRVPGIHPVIAISPPDVSLHTREFAQYATSDAASTAIADASTGLALVAADFLADSNLRAAARADFDAAGGALDVEGFFS
ncbi:amidohydrolase [Pseudoclavibacter sp. RFBJ3]|nr:amidohydrolase [Pseudoclavibacter sp. AY1H1]PPF84017.1 amidohydrolase [Pseudoclavibacter sp. RFBJ5]PPF92297.1 amidohydrolase [Pseudoclavibacter sp. RFBJ3]PPF97160.1 amidohydrolase [Pseudoclavibacter sp. RFBH5]PPG23847.1 amidohydrolase [Pseudoclavibacter sp. RFBI4]